MKKEPEALFQTMDTSTFRQVCEILDASFPPEEKRTFAAQKDVLTHPNYRLIPWQDGERVTAFLSVWEFPAFRFVEHFAVHASGRGKGLGGKILSWYLSEDKKNRPVFLEVEPPETEIARRRISFYERLGFHLNFYSYTQPPLQKGQPPVALQIMSYPAPITSEEFDLFRSTVYREVYGSENDTSLEEK